MGKRIIQQARGKGGPAYRVRKQAFRFKIGYPNKEKKGEAEIIGILHSPAHSAPLMKIKINDTTFYNPVFNGAYVGQKIYLNEEVKKGSIVALKEIPIGEQVYNIERNPGDGGKMIRTAGSSATVSKKSENKVSMAMPGRREVTLNENCRATIGIIAGEGRTLKPFVTAGRKYYKMKTKNKLWPRTSAIKVNAVDHPFGSGRGKRAKPKIAKRNAPPGRKVGHLRPRRTGYVK
ncbi:50S ribosomal protein L2 [Candidatus Pacearchaeota archaeon]|nr:50S ribosomal protein L2 [Candidatus Pacearchaeota archaeon]